MIRITQSSTLYEKIIVAIKELGFPVFISICLLYFIFVKVDKQTELLNEINNKLERIDQKANYKFQPFKKQLQKKGKFLCGK